MLPKKKQSAHLTNIFPNIRAQLCPSSKGLSWSQFYTIHPSKEPVGPQQALGHSRAPEQLRLGLGSPFLPLLRRCSWPACLAVRSYSYWASPVHDTEIRPSFCPALSFHGAGKAPQRHGAAPQDSVRCSAWDRGATIFSPCFCNGRNNIPSSKTQGNFTRATQILHSEEKAP